MVLSGSRGASSVQQGSGGRRSQKQTGYVTGVFVQPKGCVLVREARLLQEGWEGSVWREEDRELWAMTCSKGKASRLSGRCRLDLPD